MAESELPPEAIPPDINYKCHPKVINLTVFCVLWENVLHKNKFNQKINVFFVFFNWWNPPRSPHEVHGAPPYSTTWSKSFRPCGHYRSLWPWKDYYSQLGRSFIVLTTLASWHHHWWYCSILHVVPVRIEHTSMILLVAVYVWESQFIFSNRNKILLLLKDIDKFHYLLWAC